MALRVHTIINTPVSSNCHIIYDEASKGCMIVDPGSEFMQCGFIEKHRLIPEIIILTHEHFDHIWGCNYLNQRYHIPVLCSTLCGKAIVNPKQNLSLFYQIPGFCVHNRIIEISDYLNPYHWHTYDFKLYETLGHSKGGICFTVGKYFFSGDTLLKDVKTVIKLPTGSKNELIKSLDKINSCKGHQQIVYPGHGDTFDLDTYDLNKAI